jgi:hypothetical protein
LSPEIVALLVLLVGAVAAVAFTLIVVVTVDRSNASTRPPTRDDGAREQETEKR